MKGLTETQILGLFTHQALTPLLEEAGRPDSAFIHMMLREINENASAIDSPEGSGTAGHLRVVMTQAEFARFDATPYPVPTSPGPHVVHDPNATQAVINAAHHLYDTQHATWSTWTMVDNVVKNQLLKAVSKVYFRQLENDMIGFARVTSLDIITHLKNTYGAITAEDLVKNKANMDIQHNIENSIESFLARVNECQKIAVRGSEPYTNSAIVNSVITNLRTTGQFDLEIRDWKKKPAADQTWSQLQPFLCSADELR
jgi:hypothetical protein